MSENSKVFSKINLSQEQLILNRFWFPYDPSRQLYEIWEQKLLDSTLLESTFVKPKRFSISFSSHADSILQLNWGKLLPRQKKDKGSHSDCSLLSSCRLESMAYVNCFRNNLLVVMHKQSDHIWIRLRVSLLII